MDLLQLRMLGNSQFKYFVTTKENLATKLQVNVRVQLLQVIQSTSSMLIPCTEE